MRTLSEKSAQGKRRKVYLVEDHPVFREGLVQLINSEPDLSVCGKADNAEEAYRAVTRLKPDLVLVDISLPGKSGLELIKQIRRADTQVKLLVVSMHDEALYADRVLRAGGNGYVMKEEDPEVITQAIRDVLAGLIYVSEEVMARKDEGASATAAAKQANPLQQLTDNELSVLGLLGWGKTGGQIARELRVKTADVTAHCTSLKRKLKLRSTNELIRYAVCWIEKEKE